MDHAKVLGRNGRFFRRLTHRTLDRGLSLLARSPGQTPGSTEVTPLGAVLQQHPEVAAPDEQAGRAEDAPELLPVGANDPRVPWIAQMGRQKLGVHALSMP